jgi:hypothetical protein
MATASGDYSRVKNRDEDFPEYEEGAQHGSQARSWIPLSIDGAQEEVEEFFPASSSTGVDNQVLDLCNVWSKQNRAIILSYFSVGFGTNFLVTPMTYYLVHEQNTDPDEMSVIVTLAMLPWSMKIGFGFLTDNFPIMGKRRRPYMMVGWFVFVLSNLYLSYLGTPNAQWVGLMQFIGSCGFIQADVATDAMVVERSKLESEETRGSMQATGYTTRFVGSLAGSVLGACVYNKERWAWSLTVREIFAINALIPALCVYSFVGSLKEDLVTSTNVSRISIIRQQAHEIFSTLSHRAVYVPCCFIFVYNMLQVPNAAWRGFLVEGLTLDAFDLGILNIVGSVFAASGLIVYKRCFFHTSWRLIYVATTFLVSFFSLVQLALIFRWNVSLGINDLAFAVGDDALQEMVQGIQFLPVCRMYISMTPTGAEGTTYSMLTTLSNVSGTLAFSLGTVMSNIWDVSNDTLRAQDFSGMWKLTLLTSLIQPIPLLLVGLLPGSKEEQHAMRQSTSSNWRYGAILVFVVFGSLIFTLGTAVHILLIKS